MAGIPVITPYPMPAEADLPENVAGWALAADRAVLLVHDMQQFFLRPFPSRKPPVRDLVDNAVALRQRCAALGIPVVYSTQPGRMTPEQRGLLKAFWGPGMTTDTVDREVVGALAPRPDDHIVTKWRYSAFYRTDLHELITAQGRDQLLVCGVYAHVGVLMTVCDAFTRDIEAFLVADAVADFSAEYHRMALAYAAQRCAVTLSTNAVLAQLSADATTLRH
jgi:isochorismate hydrolase